MQQYKVRLLFLSIFFCWLSQSAAEISFSKEQLASIIAEASRKGASQAIADAQSSKLFWYVKWGCAVGLIGYGICKLGLPSVRYLRRALEDQARQLRERFNGVFARIQRSIANLHQQYIGQAAQVRQAQADLHAGNERLAEAARIVAQQQADIAQGLSLLIESLDKGNEQMQSIIQDSLHLICRYPQARIDAVLRDLQKDAKHRDIVASLRTMIQEHRAQYPAA